MSSIPKTTYERMMAALGLDGHEQVVIEHFCFAEKPCIGWSPNNTYTPDARPLDITKRGTIRAKTDEERRAR